MKKILTLLLCLIITSAVIITVKQKTSASDKLTTTETSGNEEAAIAQDERPIVETIQAETSPVDQIAPDERQEFEQFLHAFREACPEAKAVGELLHNNANNNSGGNYNMLRPGDTPPQPVAQIPTTLPPGLTFDINSPPPASTEVPEILQMIDKLRQQAIIHLTNLANIDTIGYRRAEPLSNGPDLHITLRYNFEPGRMKPTKRSGDLAIEGPGMFRLMPVDQAMPPGFAPEQLARYTRRGDFVRLADGRIGLKTQGIPHTYALQPEIRLPEEVTGEIEVPPEGTVLIHTKPVIDKPETAEAFDNNTPESPPKPLTIGRIELFRFNGFELLQPADNGLFFLTTGSIPIAGTPGSEGFGRIVSGHLELSNVNPETETDALAVIKNKIDMLNNARHEIFAPTGLGKPDVGRYNEPLLPIYP